MSDNNKVTKETTVSPVKPEQVEGGQFRMETWWILGGLVVALLILKKFIYTKDDKRHGK